MVNNLRNRIYALIPTSNRPKLLERSIKSIVQQTRKSNHIIVVQDENDPSFVENRNLVDNFKKEDANISLIINHRTTNLSGAVNSGLEYILTLSNNPYNDFIAILDDDDYWDEKYLEKCEKEVLTNNSDWIITGIIRHHSRNESKKLSIPKHICIEDFLSGNPHVQGSNIFIRFSKFLEAGGFDEALDSTTDRDLCIRLLQLDTVKYNSIDSYLVHHDVFSSNDRLSTPNSIKKQKGLQSFYNKYFPIMSDDLKSSFKQRVESLFACMIDENLFSQTQIDPSTQKHNISLNNHINAKYPAKFALVIGFIASNKQNLLNLLHDIENLSFSANFIKKVVIIDNIKSQFNIERLVEPFMNKNYEVVLKTKKKIHKDIKKSKFGEYIKTNEDFNTISAGRTILHSYLFEESVRIPDAIVWILDDDMRFKYIDSNLQEVPITSRSLYEAVLESKRKGVAIAIGNITGDPPLPRYSIIRTQLLDLFYNLLTFEDEYKLTSQSDILEQINIQNSTKMRDYYYDYSSTNFTHLETPFWIKYKSNHKSEQIAELVSIFSEVSEGKAISRPVISTAPENQKKGNILVRGGNTLVIDIETLRRFPNISPRINNKVFRRADTIWSLLNQKLDNVYVDRFPICLLQERSIIESKEIDFGNLLSDFSGSAFVFALNEYYSSRENSKNKFLQRISLQISEKNIEEIIYSFKKHLAEKLSLFLLTSYRITGLIKSILKIYSNITKNMGLSIDIDFVEMLQHLEEDFDLEKVTNLNIRANNEATNEIKQFLRNIKLYTKTYRKGISFDIKENFNELCENNPHYKKVITSLKKLTSLSEFQYISKGREGIIFKNKNRTFKYFYKGLCSFHPTHLDFIKKKILYNNDLDRLSPLNQIYELDGELIFESSYINGSKYTGGDLQEFVKLVLECKKNDFVLSNIHQNNLIKAGNKLFFIDLGRSIVPYTDKLFIRMCKRVYLLNKFLFRNNLQDLMTRSLYDNFMPELFNFNNFLKSFEIVKISLHPLIP